MSTGRNQIFRLLATLCFVVAAVVMAAAISSAGPPLIRDDGKGVRGNPLVLPPGSSPYGKTYGEWSAEHWKWLFSIPAPINPANDFTGANGAEGQSGQVWFLCGSFCPEPPTPCSNFSLTRNLTVPAGEALFFPIIDAECSTLEGNGTTDADLRACAKGFQDLASGMSCEVDGVSIGNLDAYRVQSPLFTFGPLPADNIFGAPAGSTSPSVSDGVFLMIRPLWSGTHTIHFTGGFPDFGFGMNITYHLTVAGSSAQSAQGAQLKRAAPNAAAPERKLTWGAIKTIYR